MSEQNKNLLRRYFDEACKESGPGGTARRTRRFRVAEAVQSHLPDLPAQTASNPILPPCVPPFPNIHFTIEDMVSEGDKVVTRFTCQGTHQGDWA